jgi:hypothetical protein
MKFEYKREWISENNVTERLNEFGQKSWEAFYVSPRSPGDGEFLVWLKRAISAEEEMLNRGPNKLTVKY